MKCLRGQYRSNKPISLDFEAYDNFKLNVFIVMEAYLFELLIIKWDAGLIICGKSLDKHYLSKLLLSLC